MKPLDHMAQEMVMVERADLHRIRRMTEAEFAILMALHAAAEADVDATVDKIRGRG